jgi:WD40 repeat protein
MDQWPGANGVEGTSQADFVPPYASWLLSGHRSLWALRRHSTSRLRPLASLHVDPKTTIASAHRGPLCALDVDRFDESFAIVGGGDGRVSLFDLSLEVCRDPAECRPPTAAHVTVRHKKMSSAAHATAVTSIQWFPLDCGAFSTSSFDGLVKVWDTETFASVFEFDLGGSVYCCRMHPHGSIIAASTSTNTVRMCDLRTGGSTHAFTGHDRRVTAVDFSRANEYIFATSSLDKTIKLWDIRKSSKQAILRAFNCHLNSDCAEASTPAACETAHEIAAMSLRFLGCGTRIASVGADGSTRLWDAFTGHMLYNMPHGGSDWRSASYDIDVGCSDASTCQYDDVVFAPARREGQIAVHQLASTDAYGRAVVRCRDVSILTGHIKMVRGLRFLAARRLLLSAGTDGLLLLWRPGRTDTAPGPFTGEDPEEVIGLKRIAPLPINEDAWSDEDEERGTAGDAPGSRVVGGRSSPISRSERIRRVLDGAASASTFSPVCGGSDEAVDSARAARPRAFLPPIIQQMLEDEDRNRPPRPPRGATEPATVAVTRTVPRSSLVTSSMYDDDVISIQRRAKRPRNHA